MGSSEDVVLRDEGSTTEPGVIDEKSHLPRPLVLLSFDSSDNLSPAGGPSIPQVAFRSSLVPLLVEAPFFLTSLTAQARPCSVMGSIACLGLYLLRSRPCAGLQCSSGLSLRPSGRARTTVAQRSPAIR